jgi:hypothetical protein
MPPGMSFAARWKKLHQNAKVRLSFDIPKADFIIPRRRSLLCHGTGLIGPFSSAVFLIV